jgi:hypothetical protein
MDIKTKLIFACVAVSLASMLLLGLFMQQSSVESLDRLTERQLESLAAARLEDIQIIRQAWREQAFLITSRTSLREQVASHTSESADIRNNVRRILDDARKSVTIFRRLAIFDQDDNLVATSGNALHTPVPFPNLAGVELEITGFKEAESGGLEAIAHAPLELGGARVGQLEAVIDTRRLFEITRNYVGLGETGEMYLVTERVPGEITVLHPLRGSETNEWLRVPRESASEVMIAALDGADGVVRGVLDYRGQPVWAAARRLPNSSAALVVKIDEREQVQPQRDLTERFIRVALSVSALAIVGGALLGAWLARPMRQLLETVDRIRDGEEHLRAEVSGEDEVSFLAESLNELMDDQTERDNP